MASVSALSSILLIFDSRIADTSCSASSIFEKIDGNPYRILVKIEFNCENAFQMLSLVYGDVILSSINFYRWYNASEESREDRNDEKDV